MLIDIIPSHSSYITPAQVGDPSVDSLLGGYQTVNVFDHFFWRMLGVRCEAGGSRPLSCILWDVAVKRALPPGSLARRRLTSMSFLIRFASKRLAQRVSDLRVLSEREPVSQRQAVHTGL